MMDPLLFLQSDLTNPVALTNEKAKFIIKYVADQFVELVNEESEALDKADEGSSLNFHISKLIFIYICHGGILGFYTVSTLP